MTATGTVRLSVLVTLAAGAIGSGASEKDRIEVQSWRTPQTGWLYVIDATTRNQDRGFSSFDPERGEVAGASERATTPTSPCRPVGIASTSHLPSTGAGSRIAISSR